VSFKSFIKSHKKSVVAAAGAGAVLVGCMGASGAWLTAQGQLPVQFDTGSLSVLINGAPSNAAPIGFHNVVPGSNNVRTQTFTVKNNGTVSAAVTIGEPVQPTQLKGGTGLTASDIANQLFIGVDGHLPYESVGRAIATNGSGNGTISLGTLAPGETGTYTVRVGLSDDAGNAWENVTAAGTVGVDLTQSH